MNAIELAEKLITTLGVLPCVISDWGNCATAYEQKKYNLTKDIQMANDAVYEASTMIRQQQSEIESLKLHIQGLLASIDLGEKYMARKNPVETLESVGAILRKANEK